MFITTYNEKTKNKLRSYGAKLVNTVKMQDKEMYIFNFDQKIYDSYCMKFGAKDIFLNNKLYFI